MAAIALEADPEEVIACGRAVLRLVAASAFPAGHNPRVGFLFAAQFPASPPLEETLVLLVCTEVAEMVDVPDALDAMDELEFWR